MPSISAILPTLNEQATISRAVTSAWAAGASEVWVVDGGSSDRTVELAIDSGASVLSSRRGRAVQQNLGAAQAIGEFLLFLHGDSWLDTECGPQLQNWMIGDSANIAAFRQYIDAAGTAYRWIEWGNARRAQRKAMAYGDQAIVVRRAVFERVGGFPEVPFMEDVRLMRKLRPFGPLKLLPGPVHVSARRWQHHGVVQQTLRNQALLLAERLGVPLSLLARMYGLDSTPSPDA